MAKSTSKPSSKQSTKPSRKSSGKPPTKASRKSAKKHRAHSLHVGLNAVSGAAYEGWTGPLVACEFDAHDMAAIASDHGMRSKLLLTKAATRKATLAGIRAA